MSETQPVWEMEEGQSNLAFFQNLPASQFAVIKVGGELIDDSEQLAMLAPALVNPGKLGLYPVVVHGGGPQIDRGLVAAGIQTKKVDGVRITSADAAAVIPSILLAVNQRLVKAMNDHWPYASGIANGVFSATLFNAIDFGSADIVTADTEAVTAAINQKRIPVISCAGVLAVAHMLSENKLAAQQPVNINADLAAVALAGILKPRKFISLTKPGAVLDEGGHPLSSLSSSEALHMIEEGSINEGMAVKIKQALRLFDLGVHDIVISSPAALMNELFTKGGSGTLIRDFPGQ